MLILMKDIGGNRSAAYNICMDAAAALPEQDADTYVSMSDAVIEALGTVLAAIARIIEFEAMRHRGGPGIVRRLTSIIAAFIAFVVTLVVRQRAIATRSLAMVTASRTLRHLRRPPQGWAAP
jgi:hypothetical protein